MSGRRGIQMSCQIQKLRPLAAFQGKLHPVGEEKSKSSKPLIKKYTWPLAIPTISQHQFKVSDAWNEGPS